MVLSAAVIAFRNVFSEPFSSSTNGSFSGYLREPHSTECSRMCGTPVSSVGRVLKLALNTLFSSSASIESTSAPVCLWRYSALVRPRSGTDSSRRSSNFPVV
eukprot:5686229-Prymnesium_polylepis.2